MQGNDATPARMLFGRGSIYTIAFGAQLSAGLLLLPVITRVLGPGQYGVVAAGAIVLQLLTYVAGAGLPGAVTRFYFDDDGGPDKARFLITASGVAGVILVTCAELTGSLWSGLFSGIEYGGAFRIAVWAALPNVVLLAAQSQLRARDQAGRFVTLAIIAAVGSQLIGLTIALATDRTAEAYFLGVLIAYVLAALTAVILTRPSLSGDISTLRSALALGLPTVPHTLAMLVIAAGDRVVIERLEGVEALGRYQVAYVIGGLGLVLVGALNNTWAPMIHASDEERRWRLLGDTTLSVARVAAIVAAGIAIAAPIALGIAAPESYEPETLIPVTAIVAASVMPYVLYLSRVHILFQEKRTGLLAWATPVVAVVNIWANLLLVPRLGLEGAALATVGSYALLAWIVSYRARRIVRVRFPTRQVATLFVAGASVVAVSALLTGSGVLYGIRLTAGLALLAGLASVVRRDVRLPR